MTRRSFPGPGDGGEHTQYPQRRSGLSILAGTALLLAAVLVIAIAIAVAAVGR